MSVPLVRPFSALSGEEVKKIILNEISRQLDADCRFRNNITYPRIAWCWKLAVNAYPSDKGTFEVQVSKEVKAPDAPEPTDPPVEIEIGSERTVAAPVAGQTADSVRREEGLPVHTPKLVPGAQPGDRITVDAPSLPSPSVRESERSAAGGESSQVETNVGQVARRVSLRTRANPEGVAPVERAGSPPGPEEQVQIEQIAARDAAKESAGE